MDYRLEIPLLIYFVGNVAIYVILIKLMRMCLKDVDEMTVSYQRLLESVTDILKALEKVGIKVEKTKKSKNPKHQPME